MARSFFGGVHPKGYKELSSEAPIYPLHPKTVSIAMSQHIGRPCTPLVKVIFLGQAGRAEIWSAERYEAEEAKYLTPEAIAAVMEELGF